MPLPVRNRCDGCKDDNALFVWDRVSKRWKCNTCGHEKRAAKPTMIDVFMRRRRISRGGRVPKDGLPDG
jgi:hypothetical protein